MFRNNKTTDMQDKELLNKALNFIVEREQDNDYICDTLNDILEETDICAETCQGLNKSCVLMFLRRRNKGTDYNDELSKLKEVWM